MMKIFDSSVIGQKFGRLLVIARAGQSPHKKATVLCKCDCGKEVVVIASNLKYKTKSCGCLRAEGNKQRLGKSEEHKRAVRRKRDEVYTKSPEYKLKKSKYSKNNRDKINEYCKNSMSL